ncbi:MAG: ribokinase [Epulopiscium sp.]|nr:ribokinase [Candidatus Epulonipiscium sp.]
MKALNFGSLNIDYVYEVEHFVQKGETISSDSLQVFSGGKGLNQSVALAKADVDVYHAGVIGEDGTFLMKVLRNAGVNTDHIYIREDVRTGNAIIQNDKAGDNCIILFGGANQSIENEYVDKVMDQFEKGDFIILQNEINNMNYIVQKAYEKGMVIILNPSPMNEKIWKLPLEYIDYFFINEVEAQQLAQINEKDEYILLKCLNEKFPKVKIVMTLGEKGSLYYDGKTILQQDAIKVDVVDTTAAGDTYTGYFVSGLMQGKCIKEVMEIASTAAAIAVTRKGAAPSIPSMKEVENKLKKGQGK